MPAMPYPKILAFVEGTMERIFVNNNFHYVELVQISNGESWSAELMAAQISSKFITKNIEADLIVVWIDCEKRNCDVTHLHSQIHASLVASGADPNKISICVPNRMTENVLLADEDLIRTEFNDPTYTYVSEGMNGKAIIKEMYRNQKTTYKETLHGVKLLKKLRLKNVAASCQTASSFVNNIPFQCWWI